MFSSVGFESVTKNDANNYEERLKDQAISSLCNHDYDGWEDTVYALELID